MKNLILTTLIILFSTLFSTTAWADTHYVRTDGGTGSQCTGLKDRSVSNPDGALGCAMKHPNWVFPPTNESTTRAAAAGDTVVIASGSYRIGCQATSNCRDSNVNLTSSSACGSAIPYDCDMGIIPSNVTLIGCSATGCASESDWPELWGAGRVNYILNISGKTGVTISDLELTDHSICSWNSGNYNCTLNSSELSGKLGIKQNGASGTTFSDLNIHGFYERGIYGYSNGGDSYDNVTVRYNSAAGIDWDSCLNGTCGVPQGQTMTFNDLVVEWNGCVEDPLNEGTIKTGSCHDNYGDGVVIEDSSGTWSFTGGSVSHNTSDGLDFRYINQGAYSGGSLTVKRGRYEGNLGNQVKGPNNMYLEDNIILSNCGFFKGQTFTNSTILTTGDNCRASGNAVEIVFRESTSIPKIYSNTIFGNGDVLIDTTGTCTAGSDIYIKNNSLVGGYDWQQDILFGNSTEKIAGLYNSSGTCDSDFIEDYNLCSGDWKSGYNPCTQTDDTTHGGNSLTVSNPADEFTGTITRGPTTYYSASDFIDQFLLEATASAVNLSDETIVGADAVDKNNFNRGASWDAGGFEYGTTGQGGGAASCSAQTISNCDLVLTASGSSDGTCSSGYEGACSYSCLDGEWSLTSNTCTIPIPDPCGNGVVDIGDGEQCDTSGPNLNGQSCASLGFSADPIDNNLACAATCQFNTSGCAAIACQDGYQEGTEQCDDGNALNTDSCSSVCEYINPNYEIFLDYTQTDPNSHLDVLTHKIQSTGLTHTESANIQYDFGENYWGDFKMRFAVRIDACSDNGSGEEASAGLWAMSTASYSDLQAQKTALDGIMLSYECWSNESRHKWVLSAEE